VIPARDLEIAPIGSADLDTVTGGWSWGGLARGAGRVAGKLAWPVTAGMAAIDGYQGYSQARANGAGVGEALGAGAQNAASGATFGLIPAPK
jgi:hypothetical protein